jgi:hypothetical protein
MLNQKKYSCGICKTTPDQISHHKSHIETQKHKDKKELFELNYKLSDEELINKYKTTNIDDISNETETILYSSIDNIKIDNNLNDYKDIQDIMETQNCISNKEALKAGYINYLNEKYPKGINWETELSKISHFDMNEDVIKSAGLEFFCLTGVLPDMKNNLGYKNSFTDEFLKKKYKFPTNPLYRHFIS